MAVSVTTPPSLLFWPPSFVVVGSDWFCFGLVGATVVGQPSLDPATALAKSGPEPSLLPPTVVAKPWLLPATLVTTTLPGGSSAGNGAAGKHSPGIHRSTWSIAKSIATGWRAAPLFSGPVAFAPSAPRRD